MKETFMCTNESSYSGYPTKIASFLLYYTMSHSSTSMREVVMEWDVDLYCIMLWFCTQWSI